MVLGSEVEPLAVRFGLYIDELHEFLAGRGMSFGSPDDLLRLAERASGPSFFRDELSSMVRAIIFREAEGIDRHDLLELLAVAVGGPGIRLSAPSLQPALEQLQIFLSSVLRSLFRTFPDEADEPVEPETVKPAPFENVTVHDRAPQTPAPVSVSATNVRHTARFVPEPVQPEFLEAPDEDRFARARAMLESAARPPVPPVEPGGARFVPPVALVEDASVSPGVMTRRNLWIAGVCGALVGLAGGVTVREHAPVLNAPVVNELRSQAVAASDLPKPSPYELPVRDTKPAPYPVADQPSVEQPMPERSIEPTSGPSVEPVPEPIPVTDASSPSSAPRTSPETSRLAP